MREGVRVIVEDVLTDPDFAPHRGIAASAGFRAFGSVLGGEGVVYLFDPGTGHVGVVDATRNRIVGETTVPVQRGVDVDVMPVLAVQGGALWLVTGPGRLTRYELATGAITDVVLPTDVVSAEAAGGPPAPGATRRGGCATA